MSTKKKTPDTTDVIKTNLNKLDQRRMYMRQVEKHGKGQNPIASVSESTHTSSSSQLGSQTEQRSSIGADHLKILSPTALGQVTDSVKTRSHSAVIEVAQASKEPFNLAKKKENREESVSQTTASGGGKEAASYNVDPSSLSSDPPLPIDEVFSEEIVETEKNYESKKNDNQVDDKMEEEIESEEDEEESEEDQDSESDLDENEAKDDSTKDNEKDKFDSNDKDIEENNESGDDKDKNDEDEPEDVDAHKNADKQQNHDDQDEETGEVVHKRGFTNSKKAAAGPTKAKQKGVAETQTQKIGNSLKTRKNGEPKQKGFMNVDTYKESNVNQKAKVLHLNNKRKNVTPGATNVASKKAKNRKTGAFHPFSDFLFHFPKNTHETTVGWKSRALEVWKELDELTKKSLCNVAIENETEILKVVDKLQVPSSSGQAKWAKDQDLNGADKLTLNKLWNEIMENDRTMYEQKAAEECTKYQKLISDLFPSKIH